MPFSISNDWEQIPGIKMKYYTRTIPSTTTMNLEYVAGGRYCIRTFDPSTTLVQYMDQFMRRWLNQKYYHTFGRSITFWRTRQITLIRVIPIVQSDTGVQIKWYSVSETLVDGVDIIVDQSTWRRYHILM